VTLTSITVRHYNKKCRLPTGPYPETAYCMSPKPAVQGPHHHLSPTNTFFSIAESAVYISRKHVDVVMSVVGTSRNV